MQTYSRVCVFMCMYILSENVQCKNNCCREKGFELCNKLSPSILITANLSKRISQVLDSKTQIQTVFDVHILY